MIQRVSGAERHVLHTGPVELCEVAGPGTNGDRIRVQSPNGLVSFPVHPDTPALKAADLVYSFTPETSFDDPGNARGAIFVLALSQTTSRDLVKALELVLVQCSALGAVAGVALLLSDAEVAEATSRPGIQVSFELTLAELYGCGSARLISPPRPPSRCPCPSASSMLSAPSPTACHRGWCKLGPRAPSCCAAPRSGTRRGPRPARDPRRRVAAMAHPVGGLMVGCSSATAHSFHAKVARALATSCCAGAGGHSGSSCHDQGGGASRGGLHGSGGGCGGGGGAGARHGGGDEDQGVGDHAAAFTERAAAGGHPRGWRDAGRGRRRLRGARRGHEARAQWRCRRRIAGEMRGVPPHLLRCTGLPSRVVDGKLRGCQRRV